MTSLPALAAQWGRLVDAIRPECRGPWLDKARRALEAELYDSAMAYFWQATIAELQNMVVSYGVGYFAGRIGSDKVRDVDSLRQYVSDWQLIEGCYQLGIISREAWVKLQYCRELRNIHSPAHPIETEIDPLEALNFIKNSGRFVLSVDRPLPGLDVKVLASRIRTEDLSEELDIIKEAISQLPENVHDSILNIIFTDYCSADCSPQAKANISSIAPLVWEAAPEASRVIVGERFARIYVDGTEDEKREAFAFLARVGGVDLVPSAVRRALFDRRSQNLIDSHFGWENFYNEPAPARALAELGRAVPPGAETKYVKALLLSYLGNRWGVSHAAQPCVEEMIQNLNQRSIIALWRVLDTDKDIALELAHGRPAQRVKGLCDLLESRPIPGLVRSIQQFYCRATPQQIQARRV
jgi:hypothetical protein